VLILPLDEARPGMTLAAPIVNPERPTQELLRRGYTLDDAVLARMRAIHIEFVYVEYPSLESLDRHLAVYLSPARQHLLAQIRQSMGQTQKSTRPGIAFKDYCSTTRDLITTLLTQGQNAIYLDQMSRQGTDAVAHAAAVAHLSLLLGLKLEQYLIDQRSRLPPNKAKDCVNLGVAGMLHDLGLTKLPEPLQKFSDTEPPTADAELREWQTHAEVGYDLSRHDVDATAAAAVFQHHQHFDGSGFPKLRNTDATLDHKRIHVFARILLCANLYDRLATPIAGRQRRPNLEIHHLIRTRYAGWVDPAILKILTAVAPPFPPGSRLKLTDGSRAIVMDVNPSAPLKPTVRRLADDNWTLLGDDLNLNTCGAPAVHLDDPTFAASLAA
jgi:HD-GYP domain-containing protein (c-di-GMP phosphodiesterase class II)